MLKQFNIYLNKIESKYTTCHFYNDNNLLTIKQKFNKDIKNLNIIYNNMNFSIENELEDA